jgi:hypothetical protein
VSGPSGQCSRSVKGVNAYLSTNSGDSGLASNRMVTWPFTALLTFPWVMRPDLEGWDGNRSS